MAEVLMFKKRDAEKRADGAKPSGQREVVVMPGVDFRAVSRAWTYLKKTGQTHRAPHERDD
jgi:hypothetical protein